MIEKTIDLIVASTHPSSGDNLVGFLQDTEWALGEDEDDLFESVDVNRSDDARSLVNARVVIAPKAASLQDVSHTLMRAYQSIVYGHYQASSIHCYREATILRFVTVISHDAFFVTGTLIATGPTYPRLVELFERDFASLGGPLKAVPRGPIKDVG